ncbi:MAG: hypothetical protein JWM95_4420 [Gemmatimonadetes bacterium]|nr:hypothetical protein [Gemmatimonadota bacterium]
MSNTQGELRFVGKALGVEAELDIRVIGGPLSIRLAPTESIHLERVWNEISNQLQGLVGFGLPSLNGPWTKVLGHWDTLLITPTLWISPSGGDSSKFAATIQLEFDHPVHIGGKWEEGGFTLEIEPDFSVEALIFGYDSSAGGLTIKARVSNPTTSVPPDSPPGLIAAPSSGSKTQIVTFPFPVPSQQTASLFTFHYLGIGQRVGPLPVTGAADPMLAIFQQLETQLVGDDPAQVLTTLAKTFYNPDRNWFIALDVELRGFRIMLLFNDPAMYGVRISVAMEPITPFSGFLFEILYQKLSPNLGVYYGALTLPYFMRRIVLDGVILILPGFSIWIYTNGDFRVNVGWPLGDSSIAVQVGPLVGAGGFYFARLRSADNPAVQPTVNYNPILAFGIGLTLYIHESFNASIFSATIDVSLTVTLQGLLAWKADAGGGTASITKLPDHYWFAGTAGLSVLIQGSVDFSIIKASVTISFNAYAGIALETGYGTDVLVHADVSVRVSVKIIFFTIHLSFSASITKTFTITTGNGTPASMNGPLDPDLTGIIGPTHDQLVLEELRYRLARMSAVSTERRGSQAKRLQTAVRMAAAPPEVITVSFALQPTAVYAPDGSGHFSVIAALFIDAPEPGGSPTLTTSFETLMVATIDWLLSMTDAGQHYSERFNALKSTLGAGAEEPLGSWIAWRQQLEAFMGTLTFSISEIDVTQKAPVTAALLPMLDALRLSYTDANGQPQDIDFDTYEPVPAGYPTLINEYFQNVGWVGADPASSATRLTAATELRQSFAAYVLADYFLMQSRNAVQALYTAALQYEGRKESELHMAAVRLMQDPASAWDLAELLHEHIAHVSGDPELDALLAAFDYASAAGMGSRYLLNGLQLPVPGSPPSDATSPLNVLTGQQFDVAVGSVLATGTLTVSPTANVPPGSIVFGDGSPASAVCALPLPSSVPPIPTPEWEGVTASPPEGGNGSIVLSALPGVSPRPLYYSTKNQIAWNSPAGARTILPLPQQLLSRLVAPSNGSPPIPLALSVLTDPPPSSNAVPSPDSPVVPPLPAVPALIIRLSIAQVPSDRVTSASAATASPSGGSPAGSGSTQYLRYIYQVSGADEATRDLIFQALNANLNGASISLLYTVDDRSSPAPSPDGALGLRSELLDAGTLVYKTNLSTLNQIPATSLLMAERFAVASTLGGDFAPVADVQGFLRLLWEVSVVNAPGFFLLYRDAAGDDLPSSIFSSPGANGGSAAQFDIVIQFAPQAAESVSLTSATNCVFLDQSGPSTAVYLAVSQAGGAPVLEYSPTYAAGSIGFTLLWQRTADTSIPVPVNELYHLIQYRILGGDGYRQSVWSLPVGPSDGGGPYAVQSSPSNWSYVQTVAVSHFQGSPAGNRYAVINCPVSLGLRVVDVYGDALPVGASVPFTPLYQDPLYTIAQWPGVVWSWHIAPDIGNVALASLQMTFDPDSVIPPGSPHSGDASLSAQWQVILSHYQLILDQLTDPNTTLSLDASLSLTPLIDEAALRGRLVALAAEIGSAIQDGLASSPATVRSVDDVLALDIPFSAIEALTKNIVAVSFTVRLSRDPSLLDPDALAHLPAARAVSYSIPPAIDTDASPGPSPATTFALEFEAAFRGFDGSSGELKLAERAGVQNGDGATKVDTVWAVRWSATSGIALSFDPTPVFFARAPLSNTPLSGFIGGKTVANVDLDAWGRRFLAAFDAFLSPQIAAAVTALDQAAGTAQYDCIMTVKEQLAATIVKGVEPLFDNQAQGDLAGARDRLQQALLSTLSSAYTVSTIVQVPATVTLGATPSPDTDPKRAPRLYGSVGPNADATTQQEREYTLTPGELELIPGSTWMTSLLSVTTPGEAAIISMPLDYIISYLQHDFEIEDAYLDYVPSSWLKFVVPGAGPLQMQISADALIPVPLISLPTSPSLMGQQASGAAIGSGSSTVQAGGEIEDALRWDYLVEIAPNWLAQDSLYFQFIYNVKPTEVQARMLGGTRDAKEALAGALINFLTWYDASSTSFAAIIAEAFPGTAGSPVASPGVARELIAQFAELTSLVQQKWDGLFGFNTMMTAPLDVITDSFRAQTSLQAQQLLLSGHDDDWGNPQYWPAVNGQAYDSSTAAAETPNGWWQQPDTFARASVLSLEARAIDIAGRQSATATAWLTRNADLLQEYTTNTDFVYYTEPVSFTSSVVPLINRDRLALMDPLASLTTRLAEILMPIANTGAGLTTQLRIAASYAYALSGSGAGAIMATEAILLADQIDIGGSPAHVDEVAAGLAGGIAVWYEQRTRAAAGAELQFAITLFGTLGTRQLPLVHIECVPVDVSSVQSQWWTT